MKLLLAAFLILLQVQYFALMRGMIPRRGEGIATNASATSLSLAAPSSLSNAFHEFLDVAAVIALDPATVIKRGYSTHRLYGQLAALCVALPLALIVIINIGTQLWLSTAFLALFVCGGAMALVGCLGVAYDYDSGSSVYIVLAAVGGGCFVASLIFFLIAAKCTKGKGLPTGIRAWLRGGAAGDTWTPDVDDAGTALLGAQPAATAADTEDDQSESDAGAPPTAMAAAAAAAPGNNANNQQQRKKTGVKRPSTAKIVCVLVVSGLFFVALVVTSVLHFLGILIKHDPGSSSSSSSSGVEHTLIAVLFAIAFGIGAVGCCYIVALAVFRCTKLEEFFGDRSEASRASVLSRFFRTTLSGTALALLIAVQVLPVTKGAVGVFVCTSITCPPGFVLDEAAAADFYVDNQLYSADSANGTSLAALLCVVEPPPPQQQHGNASSGNASSHNATTTTTTTITTHAPLWDDATLSIAALGELKEAGAGATTTTTAKTVPHATTTTPRNHTSSAPTPPPTPIPSASPRTYSRVSSDLSVSCSLHERSYVLLVAAAVLLLLAVLFTCAACWWSASEMIFFIQAKQPPSHNGWLLADYVWRSICGQHSVLYRHMMPFEQERAGFWTTTLLFRFLIAVVAAAVPPAVANAATADAMQEHRLAVCAPAAVSGLHLLYAIYVAWRAPFREDEKRTRRVVVAISAATLVGSIAAIVATAQRGSNSSSDDDDGTAVAAAMFSCVAVALAIDLVVLVALAVQSFVAWYEARKERIALTLSALPSTVSMQPAPAAPGAVSAGPQPGHNSAANFTHTGDLSNNPYAQIVPMMRPPPGYGAGQPPAGGSGGLRTSLTAQQQTLLSAQFRAMSEPDEEQLLQEQRVNVAFLRSVVKRESEIFRSTSRILGLLLGLAAALLVAAVLFK